MDTVFGNLQPANPAEGARFIIYPCQRLYRGGVASPDSSPFATGSSSSSCQETGTVAVPAQCRVKELQQRRTSPNRLDDRRRCIVLGTCRQKAVASRSRIGGKPTYHCIRIWLGEPWSRRGSLRDVSIRRMSVVGGCQCCQRGEFCPLLRWIANGVGNQPGIISPERNRNGNADSVEIVLDCI